MLPSKQLGFKLPVLAAALLTLGGCYTVLSHPQTDLTSHGQDYNDCASCHAQGFAQPLMVDPYDHYSDVWWAYYGCPWWLPDCGSGIGGGGDAAVRRVEGRGIGSRGTPATEGFGAPPPMVRTPGGSGAGTVRPAEGSPDKKDSGLPEGKTRKPPKDDGDDGKDPAKDENKPPRDDPEGDDPSKE